MPEVVTETFDRQTVITATAQRIEMSLRVSSSKKRKVDESEGKRKELKTRARERKTKAVNFTMYNEESSSCDKTQEYILIIKVINPKCDI